jgi:hypothetical protein
VQALIAFLVFYALFVGAVFALIDGGLGEEIARPAPWRTLGPGAICIALIAFGLWYEAQRQEARNEYLRS